MPKDEFERRVRDYLMGHPDVIMQAVIVAVNAAVASKALLRFIETSSKVVCVAGSLA